jgi:hypothetical protein
MIRRGRRPDIRHRTRIGIGQASRPLEIVIPLSAQGGTLTEPNRRYVSHVRRTATMRRQATSMMSAATAMHRAGCAVSSEGR